MRKLNLLCLTDHGGHSIENSVYAILQEIRNHDSFLKVDVASRASAQNEAFFFQGEYAKLFGAPVTENFKWTKDGVFFSNGLKQLNISDYDVVLMRLPRPISDDFLGDLESKIFIDQVIINKPSGIIVTSNKSYLTELGDICPDVKLCRSVEDIEEMLSRYPIVLKPLREYGGKGIVKITEAGVDDGVKLLDTAEFLESIAPTLDESPLLAMKYLKNVSNGDKRILVVNGKILACSLRLPKQGGWLCNVAQGGSSVRSTATQEEIEMIYKLNPFLLSKGILIYGADTLEDENGKRVLSEVNTLSIGGFMQAEKQENRPVIKELVEEIYNYAIRNE